jgi:hypothetical protein
LTTPRQDGGEHRETTLGEADGRAPDTARAALETANANRAAADKLVAELQAELEGAEQRVQWLTQTVTDAVRVALRASPAARQQINDFEVAKTAMLAAAAKLASLKRAGAISRISGFNGFEFGPEPPPDEKWSAAAEALRSDADAPLPGA